MTPAVTDASPQHQQQTFATAVASVLRESRRRQGITQAEVSLRTGGIISKAALANYEAGTRFLRVDTFWLVIKALGEDPGEVIAAAERAVGQDVADAPLTVDIDAVTSSDDPRLAPVRRWFTMRAAAGHARHRRAGRTISLEPGAIDALAALMDLTPAETRTLLQTTGWR